MKYVGAIREAVENQARKALDQKFDEYLTQTNSLNIEVIETNIRLSLDTFNLSISNFYRLRKYFIDKYKAVLSKKKGKHAQDNNRGK